MSNKRFGFPALILAFCLGVIVMAGVNVWLLHSVSSPENTHQPQVQGESPENMGYNEPASETATVTPAPAEKPPRPYVQTKEEVLLEGKHKPFNDMTDEDWKTYNKNEVHTANSPDVRPDLEGNPYEVIQYLMVAAKKENYAAARQCFVSGYDKKKLTHHVDELMAHIRHLGHSYSVAPQEYATGKTYIDKKYLKANRFKIFSDIWDGAFLHSEYILERKHNHWRIVDASFSCG